MPDLPLPGCTPEPLMGYLKALGVFRLVAEQADPAATLSWKDGVCRLHSTLDREGLIAFFQDEYRPTPIVAPWNGGSGFYDGGSEPLKAIENATVGRLTLYRDAITRLREFVPKNKPKDDQKDALLVRCRAELPDEVVPWLDVCFVLGESHDRPGEMRPSFFPLLGTGGNDGRLDFTNNFFQRLADVIGFADGGDPPADSAAFLDVALFGDEARELVSLGKAAVGQFNPGGIGGPNGVQGNFEAGSRVNPWDFVLMIEGALLFAGSVARRLGANTTARSVFPFSVESVSVGYGSATASEETTDGSRAELWLPLWDAAATLPEVRRLFAEGRAQIGRRQARNAVEFALAVNLLGVSRGVTAFARYGFLKRNGLAFLAAPLGRVPVTPRAAARLLDDPPLTDWLDRLRRACREKDKTPARYQTALRQIDRAMFAFANRSESGEAADRRGLVEVLRALGRAERTLAGGLGFCADKYIRPLQDLNLGWLRLSRPDPDEDIWREFRLAAALASVMGEPKSDVGPLRTHLEQTEQKGHWVGWSAGSNSAVWSGRPLADNLADTFLRRWVESEKAGVSGVSLRARIVAPLADVVAFLTDRPGPERDARDARLAELLWGMIGAKWADRKWFDTHRDDLKAAFRRPEWVVPPATFAVLRLIVRPTGFVSENGILRVVRGKEEPVLTTTPISLPFHRLARGAGDTGVKDAVRLAGRRLHADQLANDFGPGRNFLPDAKLDPVRLVAACLFPLSAGSLNRLAGCVLTAARATANSPA